MENKERVRDYKREYELRQKRNKRLHADMDRAKAEAFLQVLDMRGQTFINWLEVKIDEELKRA
jgi:hypothetical protein